MSLSLIFKSVSYKNFLATGNKPVKINLANNPTTLIYGKNGAGKSTMYEALFFCLYGKAFRKAKKPDLVNNINNKKLLVEVEFTTGGSEFRVVRGVKPNIFEIYVNGKLRDQPGVYEYQAWLEKNVLKMSADTFKQIVILGSLHYVPYMRLTIGKRREIIEELLDIQIFSVMNKVTKGRLSTINTNLEEIERKEEVITTSIRHLEEHIEDLERNTENIKNENLEKFEAVVEQRDKVDNKIVVLQEEAGEINTSAGPQLKKSREYFLKYRTLAEKEIKDLDSTTDFFTENDNCDRCRQEIEQHFKEKILAKVDRKKDKIKGALDNVISPKLEETIRQIELVSVANDKLTSLNQEISALLQKSSELQTEVNNLKDKLDANLDKDQISQKRKELGTYKGRLTKLSKKKRELTTEAEEYDFIIRLLKDDGIKKNIIKMYVPVINKLLSKYLSILGFPIKFTFDEEFKENIVVKGRRNLTYSSFSAGEKMRLDLALLFAFREIPIIRSGSSCNLLIFDEVADSAMDIEGWDSFLSIIDSVSDVGNVFVISPRGDVLIDKFTDSIKFKKSGQFSQIADDSS